MKNIVVCELPPREEELGHMGCHAVIKQKFLSTQVCVLISGRTSCTNKGGVLAQITQLALHGVQFRLVLATTSFSASPSYLVR